MSFFFFNDTATTEIYTLSLHDALPICEVRASRNELRRAGVADGGRRGRAPGPGSVLPRRGARDRRRRVRAGQGLRPRGDRKSTRLNSSHANISYAVFCLKKKQKQLNQS